MHLTRNLAVILVSLGAVCTGGSTVRAADCEEIIARHMVGEALLVAHFVALAEKWGLKPAEIDATLKSIAEKSAVQDLITDSAGHAYLTNTGVDSLSARIPQSSPRRPHFGL